MIFKIIFSANKYHSDMEGYKNGYEAFDKNGNSQAILNNPGHILVSEKEVQNETARGACLKFQKWQSNGQPESWLMNIKQNILNS